MARILVVEDDRATGQLVLTLLTGMGHDAEFAADGGAALKLLQEQTVNLVISDVHMAPIGGLELLEKAKAFTPQTRFVMFSGDTSPELHARALKLGAVDFLAKPMRIDRLKKVLDRVNDPVPVPAPPRDVTLEAEVVPTRVAPEKDFETTVLPFFPGPGLAVVRQRLSWVAQARSHVLIDARRGVLSREVLEAFHHHSLYAHATLRIINFETENPEQLRTRWKEDGAGWLQEVGSGTLVLLALDALPVDVQGVLAGLVRSEFKARIIATIRGDPDVLVAESRLHEGLYFRLALFSTRVAPLAETAESVPQLLADAVAASKAWLGGAAPPEVEDTARAALVAYAWPQNHFELRRLADQLASRLEVGEAIKLKHLPDTVAGAHWPTLAEHLQTSATAYIRRVERTMPDLGRVAEVLGVGRSALARHLADPSQPVFQFSFDGATKPPFPTPGPAADPAPAPVSLRAKSALAPMIERVLLVSGDDVVRSSLAGRLAASNREIEEAEDLLAAVSILARARVPFDFALIAPPSDVFTLRELGGQLIRVAPTLAIALLDDKAAQTDQDPYHVVRSMPETAVELVELLALLRKRKRRAHDAIWNG